MVYVKIHATGERYGHRFVIAVCDEDLIGKEFENDKLSIKITERFYKGEIKPDSEVISLMRDSTNINMVGKKAVELGIKAGMITKDNVIKIKGIPHAQATTF